MRITSILLLLLFSVLARPAAAFDADAVRALVFGDGEQQVAAIAALVADGDARGAQVLEALAEGELKTSGKRILIVQGEKAIDAISGAVLSAPHADAEEIIANNRLRRELAGGIAALKLASADRATRLAAAKELSGGAAEAMLPLVRKALDREDDPGIKGMLEMIAAAMEIKSSDREVRIAAIRRLATSSNRDTKTLLLGVLERKDGAWVEADADLRAEAEKSLRVVEGQLAWGERAGLAFAGVSLGSILLLAALGLAITYGLMGVINMAHGELIMIGAYTTYVVQNLFKLHAPGAFDWYLPCAVPASFIMAAVIGMILERGVIRFLYGRPLETLLATWGISLVLIQAVRTLFGAQNVQVENPAWMSGGVEMLTNVVLPYSRIVIIAFVAVVLACMWLLLTRTRLGLFVRGVTQNRAMASCVGVPTGRVDTLAFGLGCGIAGLAGCALSQIGNVGPDLGQSYIVDSFMVVVLGGVGQLAGTVYAALGLGFANKLLESWSGAVLAKIVVLVFIIIFIQKRPQGLFALKGRSVEN
ncbi:MAG: urea ABC transporter permease subunit UrtB [Betaproteobacteria bacterium RIFCSPLOWO2_02_FULL_62_17]|nr:MAG: urea ABC transporter permease subunit UrtB [Betaproteobacteria bacterium RIFCSPLOWO2_02_FULL_62_17]